MESEGREGHRGLVESLVTDAVREEAHTDALLYALTDEPLLQAIGHYRRQGRTHTNEVIDLTAASD